MVMVGVINSRLKTGPLVFLLLISLSCDDKKDEAGAVLLAATPPSIYQGESAISRITAKDPFFTGELEVPVESEGGLILKALDIQSEKTALATFESTKETTIGKHEFAISMGGETGALTMSVVSPETGPGTITAEGTTATAGARMATLTLLGQGTGFDNFCTVHAEGADGFEVVLVRVIAASLMEVVYNISLTQEPTQATIVMEDGDYRYEVPFAILSPVVLANQTTDQALTRGQVGWVTLTHAEAGLHFGTYFETDDENIETGEAEVVAKDTEVRIPVRVPADYSGDTLSLTANSFSEGGAVLEMMDVEVELLDPAYIAFTPSRLNLDDGEQSTGIVAQGLDLTALDSLTIEENDYVVLSSWVATDATTGTVDFVLSSDVDEGSYKLIANDGHRQVTGVVAFIDATGQVAYRAGRDVPAGDHVFFPVVVQGADLVDGEYELTGDDGVAVKSLTHIDEGCFVADLSVDSETFEGLRTLNLSVGDKNYDVYVKVTESGL